MHYAIHIIVVWLVSALALWITARLVPGMDVAGFTAALLATIVIAVVVNVIGPTTLSTTAITMVASRAAVNPATSIPGTNRAVIHSASALINQTMMMWMA